MNIFYDSFTTLVANAEFALSICISLLSSLTIPFYSFLNILLNALALIVAYPKIVLSIRITLYC